MLSAGAIHLDQWSFYQALVLGTAETSPALMVILTIDPAMGFRYPPPTRMDWIR